LNFRSISKDSRRWL